MLQNSLISSPDPGRGDRFLTNIEDDLEQLEGLAADARRMDGPGADRLPEHIDRTRTLGLLALSVASMRQRVDALGREGAPAMAEMSVEAVDEIFDRYGAYDLRALLANAIRAETEALRRDRASADASLARARLVSNFAAGLFVVLAVVLAVYFARALRRPLQELTAGAEAFEAGNLDYRISGVGPGEFGALSSRMNQMAAQLSQARDRELELRSGLEAMVGERTADLQSAVADLQKSEARRRQLLADVGHELRTPTTVIRGEAEIALRNKSAAPQDYRDSLARIAASAEQLGHQINDLLVIALEDAEMLAIANDTFDPGQELEKAFRSCEVLASLRQVELHLQTAPGMFAVRGDGQRIGQVISALIDNAIRYSHPGGKVVVGSTVRGEFWVLAVSDSGIGISETDLPQVFERGFRTANARLHRADGSGLGLSIAKALTERHAGNLKIDSRAGAGTQVELSLPLIGTEAGR